MASDLLDVREQYHKVLEERKVIMAHLGKLAMK